MSTLAQTGLTKLGLFRAYWLGTVACIGGFLFGYDSGIVGSTITLASFVEDFRYGSGDATRVNSLTVGIQQAGALVGCFLVWPLTHRWGRRGAIVICSFVFCIGALIQTINTHSLPAFYVGRIVAGLGLGGSSVIVPMFTAEMAPKEIRGRLASFYQLMYTVGIFLSYWVVYGVSKNMAPSTRQWQISVGLQLIPAGLLGIGMLTVKESARWLMRKGRREEAWASLQWVRADSSQATQDELLEIENNVEDEKCATAGLTVIELLERNNLKRFLIAAGVFLCQQSVGSTALAYYGPQFFKLLVGPGDNNILLSGIFGAVKIVACALFVFGFSERMGRKVALAGGALAMSACMVTIAAVVKTKPPPGGGVVTSSGIATIALLYIDIMIYNFSWGPLPWAQVTELFSPRIREIGMGVGVGSQWLFNFVYSFSVSYMIDGIGWATFLLFGIFDIFIALFTVVVLKETRGLSMEEVDRLYFSGKTPERSPSPSVSKDSLERVTESEVGK
ncbi:general substrate transporter [Schizophyllum commune Tattone D]|nr:general substrate transporter [Schizophyllum commune Tattone D]